jgi:signal transduction histidine kinase
VKPDEIARAAPRDLLRTLRGPDPGARDRPLRWWRPFMTPLVLLALIGLTAIGERYVADGYPRLGTLVGWSIGILVVLPLAFSWHRPLWAWRIGLVGLVAGPLVARAHESWVWGPLQIFVTLYVLFMVALREPLGVVVWTGLITSVITAIGSEPNNAAGSVVLVVFLMLLGEEIQRRRTAQRRLHAEEERSELAEARRALLEERARIARELHDVVAHSMSLVAVRAETAPYRLPDLPEPARKEFTALAETSRQTLAELRRLLGVLRTTGEPERAPQPSLTDLPDLIESARSAGMAIDASVQIRAVPAATGLAAYRIVQEALSNAARHSPGAPVHVAVTLTDSLHVVVRNKPGLSQPATGGAGHGLAGMHERATVLGGTLTAEPDPGGGFLVEADLPLPARLEAE